MPKPVSNRNSQRIYSTDCLVDIQTRQLAMFLYGLLAVLKILKMKL